MTRINYRISQRRTSLWRWLRALNLERYRKVDRIYTPGFKHIGPNGAAKFNAWKDKQITNLLTNLGIKTPCRTTPYKA